jgi:hypothetical protein
LSRSYENRSQPGAVKLSVGEVSMSIGGSVETDGSAIFTVVRAGVTDRVGADGRGRHWDRPLWGVLTLLVRLHLAWQTLALAMSPICRPRARPERKEVDRGRSVAGFLHMAPDVATVGEVRDREALQGISGHADWSRMRLMRRGGSGWLHVHAAAADYP